MVSGFSQSLLHELASLFCPISLKISALVVGFDIIWYLRSVLVVGYLTVQSLGWRRFFRALDCPKVLPDYQGFPMFLEVMLCGFEQRPGKFDS